MRYWVYRGRQFLRGLTARVDEESLDLARSVLSPAALDTFLRLPEDLQFHSLSVLRSLQALGETKADLHQAALLHDVGKAAANEAGVRLGPWRRSLVVIVEEVNPALLKRWSSPDPTVGWRYALHVHLRHPQIGAEWAAAAGCSADTCWLIEHHQDQYNEETARTVPPERLALLRALQRADNEN